MLSPTLLISINLIIGERESEKEKKKKTEESFGQGRITHPHSLHFLATEKVNL